MSTLTVYALAEGHNNTAGYVPVTDFLSVHVTELGTFEWGLERVYLDDSIEDSGTGSFDWQFTGGLTAADIAYIETTFLNDQRAGPVTVSTKLNNGTWVDVNATLALPRTYSLQGVRYGSPVLRFTGGELI